MGKAKIATAWEVRQNPERLVIFNQDNTIKEEITDPKKVRQFFKISRKLLKDA